MATGGVVVLGGGWQMTIQTKYAIGQTVTLPDSSQQVIDTIDISVSKDVAGVIIKYSFEDYFDYVYEEELNP